MSTAVPRPSREWRVAIVGGGAAGLSCAHALRQRGYRSVTVFEADVQVGGKCCTESYEGRTYELGAGAVTSAYRNVRELMREHGVKASAGFGGWFVDGSSRRGSYIPPPLRSLGMLRVASESARFWQQIRKHASACQPGFEGVDASLAMPFLDWARLHRCESSASMIEPWFTGFGYGYLDEIPAAYVLKYASLFRFPVLELLETGYQGLWERVASRLDVRLGCRIEKVSRTERGVLVTASSREERFDALVLACPLDQALAFMDASSAETALFEKVRYIDYHVVGVRMRRAPDARYGFFAENLRRENAGKPSFFYRRWMDRDLVLFYALPPQGQPIDASVAATEKLVRDLGGAVDRVVVQRPWRYFPHVDASTLAAGFYSMLEGSQGHRRTWIAGEICSFSAVEAVVAYSRALVERWF